MLLHAGSDFKQTEACPVLTNTIRYSALLLALLAGPAHSAQTEDIPAWLQKHVGTGEGQIAEVVLTRARALYREKVAAGEVSNACYFAMDVTRPSAARNGAPNDRFYVICEAMKSFRAVYSGYGNGRKLAAADFSNGRQCAKNFSNAEGSKLTMGGAYVTAEHRTSFKGYFTEGGTKKPFLRTFLLFDGEGETENAREREIGGHVAMFLRWQCRYKDEDSPHADDEGYVPYGSLVNYTGGRSNGCTTWSIPETQGILDLTESNPTSLYIYPESKDIEAVNAALSNGQTPAQAGTYWNARCLQEIGKPKFWPKSDLQPVINAWRDSLPTPAPYVLPICD
ncbi:MAG: hypothetical protein AAF280_14235 [Pseudomonadota bacterium]